MLFIYYINKLLIKKYDNYKKNFIFWALKIFLNNIKVHIFLSLEIIAKIIASFCLYKSI